MMTDARQSPASIKSDVFVRDQPAVNQPPLTAFTFTYELLYVDQIVYGPKPPAVWNVSAKGSRRALDEFAAAGAPSELIDLAKKINTDLAGAELTEAERRFLIVRIEDEPVSGLDWETPERFYKTRRIDACASGTRKPYSRRELLQMAPTLAVWLDTVNGTTDDPIPRTTVEIEADQQAEIATQAKADRDRKVQLDREAADEAVRGVVGSLEAAGVEIDEDGAASLIKSIAFFIRRPDLIPELDVRRHVAAAA